MAMNAFDYLLKRARSDPRHIVLAEGEDRRIIEGAGRIVEEGIASLTLLGRERIIRERAAESGIPDLPVTVVNPVDSDRREH